MRSYGYLRYPLLLTRKQITQIICLAHSEESDSGPFHTLGKRAGASLRGFESHLLRRKTLALVANFFEDKQKGFEPDGAATAASRGLRRASGRDRRLRIPKQTENYF